jgi:hypothetical protein
MTLPEFTRFALSVAADGGRGLWLSWALLFALSAYTVAAVLYKARIEPPPPVETKEQRRARMNAAMKYDNPYFD